MPWSPSPFALLTAKAPAVPMRTPVKASRAATPLQAAPGRAGRAAKLASKQGVKSQLGDAGLSKASRPGDPFDYTHLIPTTVPEPPLPNPDREHARAAAILALPAAKQHPAAAARLAASPGVSVQAARDVLGTIEPAAARRVNAAEGPLVQLMMQARSWADGKVHVAVPRPPELTRHDRANAAAARRERAA